MIDYTADMDREELRRENVFQRKERIKKLQGFYLDPQNERPDSDEDDPGQYVK